MKINVEMSIDEIKLIAEAIDHYDRILSFNETAHAATLEEKLAATGKRYIIREMRYLKDDIVRKEVTHG